MVYNQSLPNMSTYKTKTAFGKEPFAKFTIRSAAKFVICLVD